MAFCFLSGEAFVRIVGRYDQDGNFRIRNRVLKPYRIPVNSVSTEINTYLASNTAFLLYDSLVGWKPRPNGISADRKYEYNSAGMRSRPQEYSLLPPKATLRIAILGNSFTHGSEVVYQETWGFFLEEKLRENGVRAEVLNFGVAGYGMDQAFLRWKNDAYRYNPHIVILGFAPVDIKRNVNLIRTVSSPIFGLPFTKPRFIDRAGALHLINAPTPAPERIPAIMRNIEDWEFIEYEYYYDPGDYKETSFFCSKLVALLASFLDMNRFTFEKKEARKWQLMYSPEHEPGQITEKIIEAFARSVRSGGARFMVVHLPDSVGLATFSKQHSFKYSELLHVVEERIPFLHTEEQLSNEMKEHPDQDFFEGGGHYSARGNKIVAEVIADRILTHHKGN